MWIIHLNALFAAIRQPNLSHDDRAMAWMVVFVVGIILGAYVAFVLLAIFFKVFLPWVLGLFLENK